MGSHISTSKYVFICDPTAGKIFKSLIQGSVSSLVKCQMVNIFHFSEYMVPIPATMLFMKAQT